MSVPILDQTSDLAPYCAPDPLSDRQTEMGQALAQIYAAMKGRARLSAAEASEFVRTCKRDYRELRTSRAELESDIRDCEAAEQ